VRVSSIIMRRPVASLLITGGVVFLRFRTFSGFENWSYQWLSTAAVEETSMLLILFHGQTIFKMLAHEQSAAVTT